MPQRILAEPERQLNEQGVEGIFFGIETPVCDAKRDPTHKQEVRILRASGAAA